MKKTTKARWIALAMVASCTGCATGGKTSSSWLSWSSPFASTTVAAKAPSRSGEPDDSIRLDKKAKPTADIFIAGGELAESRNDTVAALQQYQRAIELEPKNIIALLHLGRLHDRLQQFPEAEAAYEKAIKVAPTDARPLNDMSQCLARQKRYDESIGYLNQAIQIRPHEANYRNNMATILVKAGRSQEAYGHLNRVHSVAESHYNLGVLLQNEGDYSGARQNYLAALKTDPGFIAAENMLASLGAPDEQRFTQSPRYAPQQGVVAPREKAVAKEVGAPGNMRARTSVRLNSAQPDLDSEEAAPQVKPAQSPTGDDYYEGVDESDASQGPPAQVLAKKTASPPKRKSLQELKAKIEDSPAQMR